MIPADRRNIDEPHDSHSAANLGVEDFERSPRAGLAGRGDAVEHGAPDRHRVGTQGEALQHVAAAADARIGDNRQPVADGIDDGRQGIPCGNGRVVHVARMIGNEYSIGAAIGGRYRVVGMQNSLDQQFCGHRSRRRRRKSQSSVSFRFRKLVVAAET